MMRIIPVKSCLNPPQKCGLSMLIRGYDMLLPSGNLTVCYWKWHYYDILWPLFLLISLRKRVILTMCLYVYHVYQRLYLMDPGRSTRILQVIQETASVPELHTLQPTRRPPADRSGDIRTMGISWHGNIGGIWHIYIYIPSGNLT